jgi:hypothetical protein
MPVGPKYFHDVIMSLFNKVPAEDEKFTIFTPPRKTVSTKYPKRRRKIKKIIKKN